MTLPAYTTTSEDQGRHRGKRLSTLASGLVREEMLSPYAPIHSATFLTVSFTSNNSVM